MPRNFIFKSKYTTRDIGKYHRLEEISSSYTQAAQDYISEGQDYLSGMKHNFRHHMHNFMGDGGDDQGRHHRRRPSRRAGGADIQLVRSVCPWSLGVKTEHSIANAYIDAITHAKHYVYIENQVSTLMITPPLSCVLTRNSSSSRQPRTSRSP